MSQQEVDSTTHTLREFALTLVRHAPASTLSQVAAGVLSALERRGPQRITSLAERESVSQPAMTGLVQRLDAAGLVERRPDPADGRATLIAITVAGAEALMSRRRSHDGRLAAAISSLSAADRAALEAAMPALSHLLEIYEPT